jgi:outer membrane protein OmpA-like peptidoglycan-associated protein
MRGRRLRLFFVSAGAVVLLAAGATVLWKMNRRVDDLRTRLERMQQRAASAEREALETSRELSAAREKVIATQEQALETERRNQDLRSANLETASQAEQFRRQAAASAAAAERAAAEKDQAVNSARLSNAELERVRRRRQEELDRMQRAMNRIAPTVRTGTGIVMQLGSEAFRFDFDSAVLKPANRETLSRIAGILLASEGYSLFIDGHTDDIGTDDYNQHLSERRAASVRDYLVNAGIPPEIIQVQGFGKSNPLVAGKTREAREKNRRVEIGVVDTIINYGSEVAKTPRELKKP